MTGKLSKVNLNDYQPLRDIIFKTLRDAIIVGELKPGERLMEVTLAAKMGVSRTPVREAIRKLELEGLVTMLPRKGAHVADLSVKDIMDVLEVRASLDSLAAELAVERISPAELKELKQVMDQFAEHVEKGNLQGSIKKDVEFHDIIYSSSRNSRLQQLCTYLKEQFHRFRVIYMKDYTSSRGLIREHQDIYQALLAKDTARAMQVAQEHVQRQMEAIINLAKPGNK